ncbi:Kynurenine 3-monooxygenase [Nymphon striatum]|nr:Kynurenine 3-monooxygenase [Nymphon striatum]
MTCERSEFLTNAYEDTANVAKFERLSNISIHIREMEHIQGRSINLALSVRGREALRKVGLEDEVLMRLGTPMYARMIHNIDGTLNEIPYGQRHEDCVVRVPCDTKVKRKTIQMVEKFQPVSSDLTLKERKEARSLRSVDLSDAEIGNRRNALAHCLVLVKDVPNRYYDS